MNKLNSCFVHYKNYECIRSRVLHLRVRIECKLKLQYIPMEILEEKDQSKASDGIIFCQLDFHPFRGDKVSLLVIYVKSKRKRWSEFYIYNVQRKKMIKS